MFLYVIQTNSNLIYWNFAVYQIRTEINKRQVFTN